MHITKLYFTNTVSIFVFLKIVFSLRKKRDEGIRILVYHSIAEVDKHKDQQRLTVPPRLFERQINYLLASGYKIISMGELLDYLSGIRNKTPREIVLTFDDGFVDNFKYCYHILKKRNIKGIFFLAYNYIAQQKTSPYGGFLSWQQAKVMAENGMVIGSHTLTHKNLAALSKNQETLFRETRGSKNILQDNLKVAVDYFAYPFGCKGSFNQITRDAVIKSGYNAACTNLFGVNRKGDDIYELKRTRVDWNDTLFKFKMKLAGAYDWIDKVKFVHR